MELPATRSKKLKRLDRAKASVKAIKAFKADIDSQVGLIAPSVEAIKSKIR